MYQTFYIDIDEEITSIVDRLRKTKAREVVLVVPKRAVLIQSIVNLKLLKKESERLKKELIIVTQDKLGKMLVEKTGITAEQKLDNIEGAEVVAVEGVRKENASTEEVLLSAGMLEEQKKRLENLGSDEYFDSSVDVKKSTAGSVDFSQKISLSGEEKDDRERIVNQELVVDIGKNIKSKKRMDLSRTKEMENISSGIEDVEYKFSQKDPAENEGVMKKKRKKKPQDIVEPEEEIIVKENDTKVSRFFDAAAISKKKELRDEYKNMAVSGNIKKKMWAFGIISFLIVAILFLYLFVPKAEVKMMLKVEMKSADVEIKASGEVDSLDMEKQVIPSKVVAADEEVTRDFDSTGETSANNKKAKGIITIFNEYGEAPQPLVATTRFLSEDGKMFRLVKGVTIPGISKVGSEIKPGVIEADVVADEQGEEYNIKPSKFTIPGFQNSGTEKYTKFYGKSTKAINGGGSGGETMRSVSAADISNAKNEIMKELDQLIRERLKESAGEGFVILDDAVSVGESTYIISNSEGQVADNFSMTVKSNASAVVFSEMDVKKVATQNIVNKLGSGISGKKVDSDSVSLQFGKADTDFTEGTILIRATASGDVISKIDIDQVKRDILGKSESELTAYLGDLEGVESVEVTYWPSFLAGKIPAYESRLKLTLDNN